MTKMNLQTATLFTESELEQIGDPLVEVVRLPGNEDERYWMDTIRMHFPAEMRVYGLYEEIKCLRRLSHEDPITRLDLSKIYVVTGIRREVEGEFKDLREERWQLKERSSFFAKPMEERYGQFAPGGRFSAEFSENVANQDSVWLGVNAALTLESVIRNQMGGQTVKLLAEENRRITFDANVVYNQSFEMSWLTRMVVPCLTQEHYWDEGGNWGAGAGWRTDLGWQMIEVERSYAGYQEQLLGYPVFIARNGISLA